jgi:hypothetical protein
MHQAILVTHQRFLVNDRLLKQPITDRDDAVNVFHR